MRKAPAMAPAWMQLKIEYYYLMIYKEKYEIDGKNVIEGMELIPVY